MINTLIECCNTLLEIRKYLIKKGKSRFTCKTTELKLNETHLIFNKCEEIFSFIEKKQDAELLLSASEIFERIRKLCEEINILCIIPRAKCDKMEFDLKVACSLIPVMDGSETTTKRIIDAVEMYADMLDDKGKILLITFVLKSRLSENAKLRLLHTYKTIENLIKDLKQHCLTKKSFMAIQTQLQNIKQESRSIDEYGTEIEKLFTELTISQADGNSEAFSVLKPLNEKYAIKRFSDGLRSTRLATVITARDYTSLKDAIQAAKDEETASQQPSGNVMHASKHSRGNSHNLRPTRGFNRGSYSNSNYYGQYRNNSYQGQVSNPRRGYFNNFRGNFSRPSANYRGPRSGGPRNVGFTNRRGTRNVYVTEHCADVTKTENKHSQNNESMQFFRS